MKSYVFAVKGIDITRKSITGPGCTLYAKQKGILIPETLDEGNLVNALVAHASDYGIKLPKVIKTLVDDNGRYIIFVRGIAVAALVPEENWAGFLFVPKM